MRRLALALAFAATAVLAACAGILGVEPIHIDDARTPISPPTTRGADRRVDGASRRRRRPPLRGRARDGARDAPQHVVLHRHHGGHGCGLRSVPRDLAGPGGPGRSSARGTRTFFRLFRHRRITRRRASTGATRAFCAWAGKRLCGAIQPGGPLDPERITSAVDSQLFAACSRGGTVFPYGSGYEPEACNVGLTDGGGGVEAVRARPRCVGGVPGVYDLLGNVEWVDACKGSDGGPLTESGDHAKDFCFSMVGAYGNEATRGCQFYSGFARNYRADDLGFRCCAP